MLRKTESQPIIYTTEKKIEKLILENNRSIKLPRHVVQIGSALLGSSAGVPYASPAYQIAGNYKVIGYFFAAGTLIIFGADSTWGWYNILNEINDKYQDKNQLQLKSNFAKLIGAFVLASCSGGMSFYIVSRYNDSIFFSVLTLINNFGLDFSGYYRLISFISSLEKNNCTQNVLLTKPNSCFEGGMRLALVFPIGSLIVNTYLAYLAAYSATESPYVAIPFSLVTASSTFALETLSSQALLKQVCNSDKRQQDEPYHLIRLLIKIFLSPIVLLSLSSRVYITIDNFGKKFLGYTLAALSAGSGLLFGQYVVSELVNKSFSFFSSKKTEVKNSPQEMQSLIELPDRKDSSFASIH